MVLFGALTSEPVTVLCKYSSTNEPACPFACIAYNEHPERASRIWRQIEIGGSLSLESSQFAAIECLGAVIGRQPSGLTVLLAAVFVLLVCLCSAVVHCSSARQYSLAVEPSPRVLRTGNDDSEEK